MAATGDMWSLVKPALPSVSTDALNSGIVSPLINTVKQGIRQPRWSVMIPIYNCTRFLRVTLESILSQDPGADLMQIEVVDNCSTEDDPESIVWDIGKGRIGFFRQESNVGMVANWNTCIQRSFGQLVHILHGDDYVGPCFYKEIEGIADLHLNTAFFSCRPYHVDEEGTIISVGRRVRALEMPSHDPSSFYYGNATQCPCVVIRRSFYESHGGFDTDFVYAPDVEMWARAVYYGGGIIHRDPLAYYREHSYSDTSRIKRTAGNVEDIAQLESRFAKYPGFNRKRLRDFLAWTAWYQMMEFRSRNDADAVAANRRAWLRYASIKVLAEQFLRFCLGTVKRMITR